MKNWKRIVPLALALLLLAGCSEGAVIPEDAVTPAYDESAYLDDYRMEEVSLEDEAVAMSGAPALPTLLMPEASGKLVATDSKRRAKLDYSNTKDGYVMVNFTGSTTKALKVKVIGPEITYTYNLNQGEWTTFPLSDGNGQYQVKVYEQAEGTKYAVIVNKTFTVKMTDEFAPFLRPNQYVNYENAPNTIALAEELAGKLDDPLEKVEAIYSYVVKNFTYDNKRAATVKSGYLPVLDDVLKQKKGICFDYAAVMAGMLRSQDVPCKLVTGDVSGGGFHAWVSVWTEAEGWIEGAIYFDGSTWHRMDPTFASSGKSSKAMMKYIGNGKNYSSMYFY